MANNDDARRNRWVDERLETLNTPAPFEPDTGRARVRLRERQFSPRRRGHIWILAAGLACLILAALPWPRAMAQQLWNRLLLGRVEVVQVDREELPDDIAAVFMLEPAPFDQQPVRDVADAQRRAGFQPSLPPAGLLKGEPALSVAERAVLATRPLNTADIERALARAGVTDLSVPKEWEGLTLTAEAGPIVVAAYDEVEIMQSAAFRMNTPPGFQFGRFMEMAFRVFGRKADEARALGAKFESNPALLVHFPERAPVRDVALRSGNGIIVGDLGGDDPICFFWNTQNRIYIVTASHVSERLLVDLANSIR